MEERKENERAFHDNQRHGILAQRWTPELEDVIQSNSAWANMKYYSVERKSREYVKIWYRENCQGKRVLDYCCGNGDDSILAAESGAKEVMGIDISPVAIENCKKRIAQIGVENIVKFNVRDAENTNFDDNSFDIITEYGALHHLDLEKAFTELVRLLKPEGKIICTEALGHNPFINIYRRSTPDLRTAWEVDHILRKKDILIAKKYFNKVDIYFYHLFTLLAVPFRTLSIFSLVLNLLQKIDGLILKLPGLRWQAWHAVIIMQNPVKKL